MTNKKLSMATDDLLYTYPETEADIKSRLYFESVALERKMLTDLELCKMDEPTHSFSIFSVKIAQLDNCLNEFYDCAAILGTQTNPMAYMDTATDEQVKIWSDKDGKTKKFADLSMGQKHQALQLLNFITKEDKASYKKIMAKLDKIVQNRNRIVHSLFNPSITSQDKLKLIQETNKKCTEVYTFIDNLGSVFSFYIFKNAGRYYSL